jgi:hypothetical protein
MHISWLAPQILFISPKMDALMSASFEDNGICTTNLGYVLYTLLLFSLILYKY